MAYTAVPTVATGDLWTAANQNTYLRDNFAATFVGTTTDTGDMVYSTSDDNTITALSIGTAYQVLSVNAGATAPEWTDAGRAVKITETTISATDTATIDFTSIPSHYAHLMVIGALASDDSNDDNIDMRINNNSTADDHAWQRILGVGSSASAAEGVTNETSAQICVVPGSDTPTYKGTVSVILPNYSTTDHHTWTSEWGYAKGTSTNDVLVGQHGGVFDVQEAISRITFFPDAGTNFLPGSVLTLYGLL